MIEIFNTFRISDRGGGVPHNIAKKIWQYNFSTSGADKDDHENKGEVLFSEVMHSPQSSSVPGKMHGYV